MIKMLAMFTAHHKDDNLLPLMRKYYTPIHVGAANSNLDLGKDRDDGSVDNISSKNSNYCELTATYYINQLTLPKYVGLMHYRRFFGIPSIHHKLSCDLKYAKRVISFELGLRKKHPNSHSEIKLNSLLKAEQTFVSWNNYIASKLDMFDVVLPTRVKTHSESMMDLYGRAHNQIDFENFFNTVAKLHPKMSPSIEKLPKYRHTYLYNMFIFREEIFRDYSEKLFSSLFEFEKIYADLSGYDGYQSRVYGFLAERFMTVYVDHLKQTREIKVLELPVINYTGQID